MSKLKVDFAVAEAVLGHESKTLVQLTYDRHDNGDEKAEALAKVADKVSAIIAGQDQPSPAATSSTGKEG